MSWNDDRENYLYIDKKPCPVCGGDYAMVYEPYDNKNGSRICGFVCIDCGHAETKDSQQLFALYTGKNKIDVWDLDNDYDIDDFHPDAQRVIRDMKSGRYFKPPKPKKPAQPKSQPKKPVYQQPKPQPQRPIYQQPTVQKPVYQPPQQIIRRPFIDYDVDEYGNATDFNRDYESGNFRKTAGNYKNKRAKGFPLNAAEQFRLAYSLGEIGQHHEAVTEWTTYIYRFPNSSDLATIYNNRGVEYSLINEINKSTEDYKMAIKLGYGESERLRKIIRSRESSSMLEAAKKFCSNKDYKNAAEAYEKALSYGLNLEKNWFEYGICLNEINKTDEAAKAYSKYIALYPGTASAAHHNRGNIFWSKGLYEKAYEDYTKSWSLYDQETKNKYSFIKVRINAYEALEKAYQVYNDKIYAEAAEGFERFKEVGDLGTYWFSYAYSLFELGRTDEAVAAYTKFIDKNPDSNDIPAAYNNRAVGLFKLDKRDEGFLDYWKAYDVYSSDEKRMSVLSRIYSRSKKLGNIEQFEKALTEQRVRGISDEVDAGKFYMNKMMYEKAAECFERSHTVEAEELLDKCRKKQFKEKSNTDMDDFFILM